MCDYVKKEIFLEEAPNLHLLKEEVTIEEGHDEDVIKEESDKVHKCKLCPEFFPSHRELRIHYASHSGLTCVVCSKTFKTKTTYSTHYLEMHSDETQFSCEVCGRKCASKSRLKEHMNSHNKCVECECSFKSKGDLIKHASAVHPATSPFRCEVCLQSFSMLSLLKRHSADHAEEKPFKCDQCPNAYKRKRNLNMHKAMMHDDKGRYPCEVCGKKFLYQAQLNEHMERHSKEKNHKCGECGCAFKSKSDLSKHVSILHPTETPFQCEMCLKSFSTLSLLKKHSVNHDEGKPFRCDQCFETYKYKSNLNNHKAIVHGNGGKFTCEVCGKKFLFRAKLKEHMERHTKDRNHKCSDCGSAFKSEKELHQHTSIVHPSETPFQCEVCAKRFATLLLLKKHSVTHNEERSHKCDRCPIAYKYKRNLDNHKAMVHSSEGRFPCAACGETFKSPDRLKHHMIRHDGLRDVKCGECGGIFENKNSLISHGMRVHSLQCKVCSKVYSSTSCLKRHMLRHETNSMTSQSRAREDLIKNEITIEESHVIKSESLVKQEPNVVYVPGGEPHVSFMEEDPEALANNTDVEIKLEPQYVEEL